MENLRNLLFKEDVIIDKYLVEIDTTLNHEN